MVDAALPHNRAEAYVKATGIYFSPLKGTRVYVYRWLDNAVARKGADSKDLQSLPEIKTKPEWTKKIHPGVSSFAERPEEVGSQHLAELLEHAQTIVPPDAIKDTPIFLLATAGMRLLGDVQRNLLLDQICSYARANSDFLLPDCDAHIQVIPGVTEGLFNAPEQHDHGKGHHTYGFLDMGGASAQIAYAPNSTETQKHANDLTLLRLRNVDGSTQEHKVFVTSWLEFGVHEARRRYLESMQAASAVDSTKELPDPCLPRGLRTTLDGKPFTSEQEDGIHLLGTGKFDECLRQTYPLLDKDAPCLDQPCLLHGIHAPAIDFDVNHFIGISEYWHTTHDVFEMGHKDKAYDFNTYQQRVESFCSQDWETIAKGIDDHKWKKLNHGKASEVCFKASWIVNVLHNGIGVPRVGLEDTAGSGHNGTQEVITHTQEKGYLDPFQAVNKIDSTEVSWTLGKMVLYASSQVPVEIEEKTLPVGFGSNVAGVPNDFQYPSTELLPNPEGLHGANWHDALLNARSSRRVPGLVLFLLIMIMMIFFLCGRSRRSRMFHKINNLFGGRTHPSYPKKRKFFGGKLPFFGPRSPSYERVLEDGANEFDLGGIVSGRSSLDVNRLSDNESASFLPPKRASSWGSPTPSLKFGLDNSSTGTIGLGITAGSGINTMDRTGLVVRTESRDHLAPIALGPTSNGRRSRAGSPSRSHPHRSPIMTPLSHDD
ncbi:nucleoside phosphatase family-domain-containing protein [Aspergillus tamarii]|uniref:Nucleoside phosphatase family-domain-containing protein n=1 Tax=Aspergillus tamarii TaxID=41984 RepID=A0A5N6UL55_ASPTM|nr:nucleoside phosphatase family-domain-containing protein [Aspergillus tamarii]